MKKRIWVCFLLTLLMMGAHANAEPDDLYAAIPRKSSMTLVSPKQGDGMQAHNLIDVEVSGKNLDSVQVMITWAGQHMILDGDSAQFKTSVQMPATAEPVTVTAYGYVLDAQGVRVQAAQESVTLKTPRETLIDSMIAQAKADYGNKSKNFLRAEKSADAGMCKNFVMRMFTTYKDQYEMQEFPGVEIFMPLNDSSDNCAPYRYGVQWRVEEASDGNCFDTVYAFRYDGDKTREENRAIAREMLEDVQRGDCFQLVGVCEDFNSPHSLIFIEDYDADTDKLQWTDCNMKGTRINGERWGWVQYGTTRSVEWMLDTICRARNGATLYRLRGDIVFK